MKQYLVVVDMQKDFADGALGTPELHEAALKTMQSCQITVL